MSKLYPHIATAFYPGFTARHLKCVCLCMPTFATWLSRTRFPPSLPQEDARCQTATYGKMYMNFRYFFVCVRVRFMKYVLVRCFKSLRRLNDLYDLSSPSLISLGARMKIEGRRRVIEQIIAKT